MIHHVIVEFDHHECNLDFKKTTTSSNKPKHIGKKYIGMRLAIRLICELETEYNIMMDCSPLPLPFIRVHTN